jgi:Uma2 family endonuclease
MNDPAYRMASYDDLLDLPVHVIGEILNGQLVTQPRPAPRYARASSIVGGELITSYDQGRGGPGGWWILFEPELHLGRDILVPDLAGWRRETMPNLPEDAYFSSAPDWVCEVLSSGTARIVRAVKMLLYAQNGVSWLWLVDPDARTLEVYRLLDCHWLLEHTWQNDDVVNAPPFAEVSLTMNDLWVPVVQTG